MTEITASQRSIIDKLIFPEPFDRILEETGLTYGELRDELITMLNEGLVTVMEENGQKVERQYFYDTDNLRSFSFQATKNGLAQL
ncbi:MAG: hypothetical protein ACQETE_09060 [Bacteroidota bacterium]